MKSTGKYTPQDVARWIDGEITDPRENRRIADAIAQDEGLAKVFETLGGADDDLQNDGVDLGDSLRELVRSSVREMNASSLWGISDNQAATTEGKGFRGTLFGLDADRKPLRLPIAVEPLANGSDMYRLEIKDLPTGVQPISLMACAIGIATEAPHADVMAGQNIPWEDSVEQEYRDGRIVRKRGPTPEGSVDSYTVMEVLHARGNGDKDEKKRSFTLEVDTDRHYCNLECSGDPEREMELAILEEVFPSNVHPKLDVSVRIGAILKRSQGTSTQSPFFYRGLELQLPMQAESPRGVNLTLRAAGIEDLCYFTPEDKSEILANGEPTCFPLEATTDGYQLRILPSEWDRIARNSFHLTLAVITPH